MDPALADGYGLEFARETSCCRYSRRLFAYNEFLACYVRAASRLARGELPKEIDLVNADKPRAA